MTLYSYGPEENRLHGMWLFLTLLWIHVTSSFQ